MRFWAAILGLIFLGIVAFKLFALAVDGKLFEPGALRSIWRAFKRDLWLGARLFVFLWLAYLVLTYLVRTL
ncbi:hypothetical protein JW992_00965 [candidate division KSB1 bacterium]|nr:hypothetical protein [candidate division KSB1 bacterium]